MRLSETYSCSFIFKVIHPDYWDYQKRLNQNESMDPLRKKSSESEYHLNTLCKHSGSLNNIHTNSNNQLKYGRYSVCEFNRMKSSFITNKQRKSTNFTQQKNRNKSKDIYQRRNSERYSFNLKKTSLSNNNSRNSCYNRGQPLHYITCKRDSHQPKILGPSLSSTTTSNFTRSTMTTNSDSSSLMDQNKLRQTVSNNSEQSLRLHRK